MELQQTTIDKSEGGITTYYYKLVDQYTNRDVWDIGEVTDLQNVSTNYLGYGSTDLVNNVNPSLTFPTGEPVPEDEEAVVNNILFDLTTIQTTNLEDTIHYIRSRLLAYDLILPPFTIVGEDDSELYEIELFDKNFTRFWLLELQINKFSATYQVTAKINIL